MIRLYGHFTIQGWVKGSVTEQDLCERAPATCKLGPKVMRTTLEHLQAMGTRKRNLWADNISLKNGPDDGCSTVDPAS
ncbi:unnamed protein product [Dovyalis caffra]|uniref:Uncharacterized protein n=1 Tax=Dovyalis caffra TaxID=77055 RepID=A0AAV1QZ03_9ROSI|nr:unnamed protein product [Dovyalis caffra]